MEADVAMHLRWTYHRITQLMRETIDEYGLTFRLLHILMLVDKNPHASQKELADSMKLTQGAVSGSIKRLIQLNMLEQVPLESDMRYNRLIVTENGKKIVDNYKEHVHRRYDAMFLGFDDNELKKFNIYLSKINKNLDQMNKEVE